MLVFVIVVIVAGKELGSVPERYSATLICTFALFPIVLIVMAVGHYIVLDNVSATTVLLHAGEKALILWILGALAFNWLAMPQHAIPSSFLALSARRVKVRSQLDQLAIPIDEKKEVLDQLNAIEERRSAISWIKGEAYTHVWECLHRAEESLLRIVPQEVVVKEALYDELRVKGSDISHQRELIGKLKTAVGTLYPQAYRFFEPTSDPTIPLTIVTPSLLPSGTAGNVYDWTLLATGGVPPYRWKEDKSALSAAGVKLWEGGLLNGMLGAVGTISFVARVDDSAGAHIMKEMSLEVVATTPASPGRPDSLERAVVRTVREAVNEYRDARWNGLILARNRVITSMFWVSLVALALLTVCILTCIPKSTMVAVATVYLVGAIAGLLGRMQSDAQADTAVEDEGLSLARLVATPLFSGVAAVGGVMIMALLTIVSTSLGPSPELKPLTIVTESRLPNGVVDSLYCEQLVADGGVAPYRWSLADSSAIGFGFTLSSAGLLCGTPSSTAALCFDVAVSDGGNSVASKPLALVIGKHESSTKGSCPRTLAMLGKHFDLGGNGLILLVAAVFGLTPGLLLDHLLKESDRYKAELKKSRAIDGAAETSAPT
jgi:hypothetical protein